MVDVDFESLNEYDLPTALRGYALSTADQEGLLETGNRFAWRALACYSDLDPNAAMKLAKLDDEQVHLFLADNPAVGEEVLLTLAEYDGFDLGEFLWDRRADSAALVAKLAVSSNDRALRMLASDLETTGETIALALSIRRDSHRTMHFMKHPNTPLSTLEELTSNSDIEIAEYAKELISERVSEAK
ncbi:hypothetical protein ACFSWE_04020 [Leucobacter albus]|uniref:Leucine rich repeat (LRR) protein n=1 Tax=Leucobacter albus TaxID=272210 RepID=A0ABW3TMY8_9MICO